MDCGTVELWRACYSMGYGSPRETSGSVRRAFNVGWSRSLGFL